MAPFSKSFVQYLSFDPSTKERENLTGLSWIDQLEERISESEDRSFEIIKSEKQKERKNEEKWEKP